MERFFSRLLCGCVRMDVVIIKCGIFEQFRNVCVREDAVIEFRKLTIVYNICVGSFHHRISSMLE